MPPSGSNEIEQVSVSNEKARVLLTEKLNHFRATNAPPSQKDIMAIFSLLKKDGRLWDQFMAEDGLRAIIQATGSPDDVDDEVLVRSIRVFLLFLRTKEKKYASHFLEKGGLDFCLGVIESQKPNAFLLVLFHAILSDLFQVMKKHDLDPPVMIATRVVEAIVTAMELHHDDGIVFAYGSKTLVCLSDKSNAEITPELHDRLSKRVIEGIGCFQHYRDAQAYGRGVLRAKIGLEKAKEVFPIFSCPIGPFVSQEVSKKAFACVLALRDPTFPANNATSAVEALCRLSSDESNQTNAYHGLLVSLKAIPTILDATRRTSGASSRFLRSAAGVFCYFIKDSQDRSKLFVSNGGFTRLVEIGMSEATDALVSISCMRVACYTLHYLEKESLATMGLRAFIMALECATRHEQDAKVYCEACSLLKMSLGPHMHAHSYFLTSGVRCVYHGILKHQFDEDAQKTGRRLLAVLVGSENAKDMIEQAEKHHRQVFICSSAA